MKGRWGWYRHETDLNILLEIDPGYFISDYHILLQPKLLLWGLRIIIPQLW